MISVVVSFGRNCHICNDFELKEIVMGKDKMVDKEIEKLAKQASEEMDAYVKETGRMGVGLVYAIILGVSAKLSDIFNPEDVVTAFEMLAKQLRDLVDKVDETH